MNVRVLGRPDLDETLPKRVLPTRTVLIPPSIAAFTARNLGIIPPLTKLAVRRSSGLAARSRTTPFASFTPSTSVKKTNSADCNATATAAAVSSPFTFNSEFSPKANVGITGSRPASSIAVRATASARTPAPTRPQGPGFFDASIAPNIPTAGIPSCLNADTSAVCTSPRRAIATAPIVFSSVTRSPSIKTEATFIRSSIRVI